MSWHEFLDDDLRDLAALYVVGALEPEEARRHRLHLHECETCRGEADSLARTAASLTLNAPQIEPPPALYDRVLARFRAASDGAQGDAAAGPPPAQVWKVWSAPQPAAGGLSYEPAGDAGFERTSIAGIRVRRLAVDPLAGRVTMLVRMAPGTAYPAHRHGGAEECFVLEGDVRVGEGLHMRAGDFQRAEAGSVHPVQTTDGGCLLLIASSTSDELL
jgi:anti-sigma factor ChrR (cupin superfamily)